MYEYRVKKIVKVVDGDTVDIEIDLGFSLTKKERCRVAGIDTPSVAHATKKKTVWSSSQVYMTGLLKNAKELKVRTEKDGKYGRMLGWFYADDNELSLNEQW